MTIRNTQQTQLSTSLVLLLALAPVLAGSTGCGDKPNGATTPGTAAAATPAAPVAAGTTPAVSKAASPGLTEARQAAEDARAALQKIRQNVNANTEQLQKLRRALAEAQTKLNRAQERQTFLAPYRPQDLTPAAQAEKAALPGQIAAAQADIQSIKAGIDKAIAAVDTLGKQLADQVVKVRQADEKVRALATASAPGTPVASEAAATTPAPQN